MARQEEEAERSVIIRHKDERLELESLFMAKYGRWQRQAIGKYEIQKEEVRLPPDGCVARAMSITMTSGVGNCLRTQAVAVHTQLRSFSQLISRPNRELYSTEVKAAPLLKRIMETGAMSPRERAKLEHLKRERFEKRDMERLEAAAANAALSAPAPVETQSQGLDAGGSLVSPSPKPRKQPPNVSSFGV
jgi:hypothetical protein